MWSCRFPCPLHITWSLHLSSVDAPVDVHGRSHSFPLIHPREVFLAWHWVDIRPPSSCCVVLLSLPLGVGLTGVGWFISPILGRHPYIRECQPLMQWGGVCYGVGHMAVHTGLSLHMRGHCHDLMHHLMRLFLQPILNLPLSLEGIGLD